MLVGFACVWVFRWVWLFVELYLRRLWVIAWLAVSLGCLLLGCSCLSVLIVFGWFVAGYRCFGCLRMNYLFLWLFAVGWGLLVAALRSDVLVVYILLI